jgi:hypothetical protein
VKINKTKTKNGSKEMGNLKFNFAYFNKENHTGICIRDTSYMTEEMHLRLIHDWYVLGRYVVYDRDDIIGDFSTKSQAVTLVSDIVLRYMRVGRKLLEGKLTVTWPKDAEGYVIKEKEKDEKGK